MKLGAFNRSDGEPMLTITSTSPEDGTRLKELLGELHQVQLSGIKARKSGIGNPCGSQGDGQGISDLTIGLKLGGPVDNSDLERVALPSGKIIFVGEEL